MANVKCVGCGLEGYQVEERLAATLSYEAAVLYGEDEGIGRYVFRSPEVQNLLRTGEYLSAINSAGALAQRLEQNKALTLKDLLEGEIDEEEWEEFEEGLSEWALDVTYLEEVTCFNCGEDWEELAERLVEDWIYLVSLQNGGNDPRVARFVSDCPQVQTWLNEGHYANAIVWARSLAEKLTNRETIGWHPWADDDDEDDESCWEEEGDEDVVEKQGRDRVRYEGTVPCPGMRSDLDDETEDDFQVFLEEDEAWNEYLSLKSLMEDRDLGGNE